MDNSRNMTDAIRAEVESKYADELATTRDHWQRRDLEDKINREVKQRLSDRKQAIETEVQRKYEAELAATSDHWKRRDIEDKISEEIRQRLSLGKEGQQRPQTPLKLALVLAGTAVLLIGGFLFSRGRHQPVNSQDSASAEFVGKQPRNYRESAPAEFVGKLSFSVSPRSGGDMMDAAREAADTDGIIKLQQHLYLATGTNRLELKCDASTVFAGMSEDEIRYLGWFDTQYAVKGRLIGKHVLAVTEIRRTAH